MEKASVRIIRKILAVVPATRVFFGFPQGSCRFHPTCTAYACSAFESHSFFKAAGLTLWRVLRCNPLSKGGFDPVPKP